MKKFLLSLACMLGVMAASATTVTIDPASWTDQFAQDGDNYVATIEGYKITLLKGASQNALVAPDEYSIRVYQGASLKVEAPAGETMAQLTVTVAQNSKATSVTLSDGWKLEGNVTTTANSTFAATSNGLESIEIAGDKQLRIAKIEISDVAGETPEQPGDGDDDPVTPGVDGEVTIAAPFTGLVNLPGDNNVSGYTFTFATNSGSTKPTVYQANSIRLYAANTLTISGTKITKIVFKLTSDAGFRYTSFKPSTGALNPEQAVGDTQITWEGDAASVTFTVGAKATMGSDGEEKAGQIRIESITIYGEGGEGGDTPVVPTPDTVTFEKATSLENGQYVFVIDGKVGEPAAAGVSYGRITIGSTAVTGTSVETVAANAFDIEVANGKATIKDANGRYYGMDDSHFTLFQFYTEVNEGCYWTYEFVGETVKFTNALNTNCFVCQSKGNQGTWYANVAPAAEPAEFNLPMVFKNSGNSAVTEVVVDENAPVEYYNLQGVRVENPSNGLYIKRQGSKVTKVIL